VNPLSGLVGRTVLDNLSSVAWCGPELLVTAGMVVVLLWDLFRGRKGSAETAVISLLFLAAAIVATAWRWAGVALIVLGAGLVSYSEKTKSKPPDAAPANGAPSSESAR